MTDTLTDRTKPRRTQAERSADMRSKIIDATIHCICELGLSHASSHEIAKAAGISRGALNHHYSSRFELLEATFGHVLDEEVYNLAIFSSTIAHDGSSLRPLIENIWERYKTRLFMVTVDYLAQARVDDETLQAVTTEAMRFNNKLNDVWDLSLADAGISTEQRRMLMNQTMCLVRGMALQRIWRHDENYFAEMLEGWIKSLEFQLAAR